MKLRMLGVTERSGSSMKAWAVRFYNSDDWKDTRETFLQSKDYICERCGEPAKIAHHKIWLTEKNINDVSITLCWDNLEALCQDCHNKEHHKKEKKMRYRFDKDGNILPPIENEK